MSAVVVKLKRYKRITIPDKAHPLIRAILIEMLIQKVNYQQLAQWSGVKEQTVRKLRRGRVPHLQTIEAMCNALGLCLEVKRSLDLSHIRAHTPVVVQTTQ